MAGSNSTHTSTNHVTEQHRVIVIGNGPSGLCMSAYLCGWRPYYNEKVGHPNRKIHDQLMQHVGVSLMDQDISWWTGDRGASTLLDELARPDTDLGHEHKCTLKWVQHKHLYVDHVVLAQTPSGGSWHNYSQNLMCVSANNWFDLPGVPLTEWIHGIPLVDRLPVAFVRKYFEAYPKLVGIHKQQRTGVTVIAVKKNSALEHWTVECEQMLTGERKTYSCAQLVLATGVTQPRKLHIAGESELPSSTISYTLPDLERQLGGEKADLGRRFNKSARNKGYDFDIYIEAQTDTHIDDEQEDSSSQGDPCSETPERTVLIVGDGLSAADAVVRSLVCDARVLHVFRNHPRKLKSKLLGRLGLGQKSRFVDYRAAYDLMSGRTQCSRYVRFPQYMVTHIDQIKQSIDIDHQPINVTEHKHTDAIYNNNNSGGTERDVKHAAVEQRLRVTIERVAQAVGAPLENMEKMHLDVDSMGAFVGNFVQLSFLGDDLAAGIQSTNHQRLTVVPETRQCVDTHRRLLIHGLFAVGPLAGDSFVRHTVGGCLQATRGLLALDEQSHGC